MWTCGPCRVPREAARRTVPVPALRSRQWAALSAQGWTIWPAGVLAVAPQASEFSGAS